MKSFLLYSAYCLLALGVLSLTATPASAQKVKIDFDREFEFQTLKTYAWKVHPEMEANPELRASIGAEIVRMAVSRELLDKGFLPADGETPDFYVTGFGSREGRTEITGSSTGWYGSSAYWSQGWQTYMVRDYVEGTLVLDIVDAESGMLAWRAYCQGAIRNPSKRDKVIDKALKKAFKKFPPK